ncbi:MAG: AAA family ATPase [Candidatus Omnitrophica bacterium]|nr:AAA family ATPase [Candidatus Omnitrophota bacterium]
MSFKDIKGQERPVHLLQEYIRLGCLTGSYLFTGEEGIGKMLTAKTLAKVLNCEAGPGDSCDACPSCLKIEKGEHPDVQIIDGLGIDGCGGAAEPALYAAGQVKIEQIRQMQRHISLRPYEGKRKVFIIDNAHTLTQDAGNALLKILEEPPAASLIILISAKSAMLLKTIVSRCKSIKFFPLKRSALEEILKNDFRLEEGRAHFLAYFSEGRLGRAIRLKDSDILKEKNSAIDGFAAAEDKARARTSLNALAAWFRDIYILKAGAPCSELINLDRKEELSRHRDNYTFADLDAIFNSISTALFYLERNANVKLLMSNLKASLQR